jgi:hypothetical protein
MDRPLIKPEHYKKFIGNDVKLSTIVPIEGQKKFIGKLADWLKDILEVLNDLGVQETNTYVKLHQHNRDANSHYDEVVATLTSLLNFQPLWVPKISRFSNILPAYDLVICGLTTGIYECAMHGVPHIIYGMSPQRVGVLRGIDVPYAKNSKELITCLSRFDNERAANANSALCAKLKAGRGLGSTCLSGIIT